MVNIKDLIIGNIGKITLISFMVSLCSSFLGLEKLPAIGWIISVFFLLLYLFKRESIILLSILIGGIGGVIFVLAVYFIGEFILNKGHGWGSGIGMFGMIIIIPSSMLLGFLYGLERKFLERITISFILTILWIIVMFCMIRL